MASDTHIFWSSWLRATLGSTRGSGDDIRTCTSCIRTVRLSEPTAVEGSFGARGHAVSCPSFAYADGLGLSVPYVPLVTLRASTYWNAFLEPIRHVDSDSVRKCSVCEEILYVDDPARVQVDSNDYLGHEATCPTLAFASTLGFPSPGGGGGEFGPMFGEDFAVFGSEVPFFGQPS